LSLRDRLNQARDLRSRRQQALGNLQREEAEHRTLESRLTKCQAQMESLRVETGAKTAEEIPQALERSNQRRQLEEARSRLRKTLHQMAGASSIDDFLNEAMQQQEGLEARIAEGRDAREGLNARIEELNQKVAISQQKMDEWKRATSEAALERQEIASMKEQVAQDVRTYAVQSLAQFVLHQSIERYCQHHQGALLSRAGDYFKLLTDQQFKEVKTDMDETGKPILVACRNDPEEQVEVTGLSDGTRDQLFLALRLAGIEKHLDHPQENSGPMPLLLDDILVNFDDRRAEATFRCLGKLSQKTQILLFTHHRHLADIAKKALQEGETLFLHELNNTPIS
ncbi:MAG: ATP-binding protein, partial [Gemmataceae bacterium]